MKKIQKLTAMLLTMTLALSLGACGGSTSSSTDTESDTASVESSEGEAVATVDGEYSIGIIQMMDHEALNSAREGFIQALADNGLVEGENLTIDYQNGQGDQNNLGTIADQFVADNEDLVFAIATPAAQAVASKTTDIPIVGTAITSYTEAGLVESDEAPGGNVTGTTDMNPITEQMELMVELFPDAKTVGFLYNSAEDNSILQVAMAKEVVEGMGLASVEKTVQNTNDVQQAVSSIINECDVIYIPTDNVLASSMPIVNEVAMPAGIAVFCGEANMVEQGGFGTLGITYDSIGYQAGLMAVDILVNGADPATMPIQGSSEFEYSFNQEYVDALGITLPDEYAEFAK